MSFSDPVVNRKGKAPWSLLKLVSILYYVQSLPLPSTFFDILIKSYLNIFFYQCEFYLTKVLSILIIFI